MDVNVLSGVNTEYLFLDISMTCWVNTPTVRAWKNSTCSQSDADCCLDGDNTEIWLLYLTSVTLEAAFN